MIENTGSIRFEEADASHVPLNIYLGRVQDEKGLFKEKYELVAHLYKPGELSIDQNESFRAVSESREELENLIREHVVPLYETALIKVKMIAQDSSDRLDLWES